MESSAGIELLTDIKGGWVSPGGGGCLHKLSAKYQIIKQDFVPCQRRSYFDDMQDYIQ